MLPQSNRNSGFAVAPNDRCINRWVNMGPQTMARPFSPNVIVTGGNALNMASKISMSFGDDPDTPAYKPTKGPCIYPQGVPEVLINGIPTVTLLSPTVNNAGNARGGMVAVPSATNVLVMRAVSETSESDELTAVCEDASLRLSCEVAPNGVGYLRVETLATGTATNAGGAIRAALASGMTALVVDIRGNPGGDVVAAIELASIFLPAGTRVATLVDRDGDTMEIVVRPGEALACPLTVLCDGGTASAAELFVGALQEHGRALVVGHRTYGKGVIAWAAQRRGELHAIPIKTCLLPSGRAIDGVGIEPDVDWDLTR